MTRQPPDTDAPAAVQTPVQPRIESPPDPVAGGNYLRDPVTGALSVNPSFEIPQE